MDPINNQEKAFKPDGIKKTRQVNALVKKTEEVFFKAKAPTLELSSLDNQLVISSFQKLIEDFSLKIEGKNLNNFSVVESVKNSVKNQTLQEDLGKQFFLSLLIKTEEYAPDDATFVVDGLLSDIRNHEEFKGEDNVFIPEKIDSVALSKVLEKFEEKKEIVVIRSDGKEVVKKFPKKLPETIALKRLKKQLELVLKILSKVNTEVQKTKIKDTTSTVQPVTSKVKAPIMDRPNHVSVEEKRGKNVSFSKEEKKKGSLEEIENSGIQMERKYVDQMEEKRSDERRLDNKRAKEAKDAVFNDNQDRKKLE